MVRVTLRDAAGAATDFFAEFALTLRPLIVVTISPASDTAYKNQNRTFSASLVNVPQGQSNAVNWTVEPTGFGSINTNTGVYSAPASVASAQALTVRATSVADSGRSGTAALNLLPVQVVVNGSATVSMGSTANYLATVTGTSNTAYTWDALNSSFATLNQNTGVLTVGTNFTTPQTVTLVARSSDETSRTGSLSVTLNPSPGVYNLAPQPATVYNNRWQTFTATTVGLGSPPPPLTWSVSAAGGADPGYIVSNTGEYRAPFSLTADRTVTITAYASGGYTRQGTITAKPGIVPVSLSPSSGSGAQQAFTLTMGSPLGASEIQDVMLWIGSLGNEPNSCRIKRNRVNNSWILFDNNGYGEMSLTGASISNSQCTLYASGTSESVSGNNVTFTANVAFTNYGGQKTVYAYAGGPTYLSTGGWIAMGTWTPPTPPVTISISPSAQQTVQGGQTKQYTATVNTGSVTWSMNPQVGSITTTGLSATYNAPATISTNQYLTITATSTVDPTKSASATLYLSNIPPPPSLLSFTPLNGNGANPSFVMVFGNMPADTPVSIGLGIGWSETGLGQSGTCTLGVSGYPGAPMYAQLNHDSGSYVMWSYTAGGSPNYGMWNNFCSVYGGAITGTVNGNQFTLTVPIRLSTWYPETRACSH
jgi:hypothetical protein